MISAAIRPYASHDLGRLLQLWERTGAVPAGADGLTVDQAVDLLHAEGVVALVAEVEETLVGAVLGSAAGAIGTVHRLTVAPGFAEADALADELLAQLEGRLAESGARKLVALSREDDPIRPHLDRRDYRPADGLVALEREMPAAPAVPEMLARVDGRVVPPGLWEQLKGLEAAKEIIERRVILPLAQPKLAARHAVLPPHAIVLFGPPGTGKTTFALGIASRLGWPFVEVEPAELAGEGPDRQAALLAQTFDRVLDLASVVVFVDEVEDLASVRHEERRVTPSVTNEFLRQIPRLRAAPAHLLVCATNWVSRLDPAFLRPGRFDYVLPVGPPDEEARAAIWTRYVDEISDEDVAISELVSASNLFTPADIEFAGRKAAQQAFEREHFEGLRHRARTEDFLAAIRQTRPTLSEEIVEAFAQDTERFGRL